MRRPIAIDFYGQSGQRLTRNLQRGWNNIPSLKAGIWVRGGALEIWNACPGAGEIFLDRMEVTFDEAVSGVKARANWRVQGPVLIIGAGMEYVPPRACLPVRWDYDVAAPVSVPYGPAVVHWAASQKRNLFDGLCQRLIAPRDTGMWAPGIASPHRQCDPPGADERNGVAGWEQDGPGFLLESDLVMERMAVGCLSSLNGQPAFLSNEPDYTLDTGWTRHGQLYAFSKPVLTPGQETREPLMTWPGFSPYRDTMLGKNISQSFTRLNGQHRGNAQGYLRAAAQCGDESATFALAVLANDAAMAKNAPAANPRGGRDMAWRIDAWAHARAHWRRAMKAASEVEAAQTPSGGILRAPAGYGFNPSPQSFGMPADYDSDALMERDLTIYALGLFGKLAAIKKAILGRPQPSTVKFVGVGRNQSEVFDTYQHPCGNSDFFPMLGLGVWATLEPASPEWRVLACAQPTPEGRVCSTLPLLRDQLRIETRGREQTAMLLAAIEGLIA